jgi:hypothetical protein
MESWIPRQAFPATLPKLPRTWSFTSHHQEGVLSGEPELRCAVQLRCVVAFGPGLALTEALVVSFEKLWPNWCSLLGLGQDRLFAWMENDQLVWLMFTWR